MDKDIIIVGTILFVAILVHIYIYFETSKFVHIMNHPEMIQEMEKVPLWLKIRVWSQYGRYVGNHITEEELEKRERCIHLNWTLDAMRYGYMKRNTDPITLEEIQEYIESLTDTYRMIWMKILSSKNVREV